MRHRFLYPLALLVWLASSCTSSDGTAPASNTTVSGPHFQFSRAAREIGDTEANWCRQLFPDALLVNADPANIKRRYFILAEKAVKIGVGLGATSATCSLKKAGPEAVEVLTGDQFPECLSSRANCSLENNNTVFRYDNQKGIHFTISLEAIGSGLRVWIEMPPESEYGLTVRCPKQ